jgi:pimeloyl-ACP methyl ester carboxylesterase
MQRRGLLKSFAAAAAAAKVAAAKPVPSKSIVAADGASLFHRDYGAGEPIVFVAPFALNSDWWEYQIAYLAEHGHRSIAYDRRAHGRSGHHGRAFDFDTLAADLAAVLDQLGLNNVTLVGHSMGCAEIARYLSRYGARRVARAILIATTTPFSLKTRDNPQGIDASVFENARARLSKDRPHQIAIAAPAFFGSPVSDEISQWWIRMMLDGCSLKTMLDLHRSFTETDFRLDLPKITVPTLLIHGDKDTSAILDLTSRRTLPLIPNSQLKIYEGAAHGLPITHMDRLNVDILAFANRA